MKRAARPNHASGGAKTVRPIHNLFHTVQRTMSWRRTAGADISRRAATKLSICVAVIFSFTCLVLATTVWNRKSAPEPFYASIPGIDLSHLTTAQSQELLQRLNTERCPCECMRTVASCRNNHGCSLSLERARKALALISDRRVPGARN